MAGSSKQAVEGLISDPSRISVAIRNDRTVTGHLLNELRNRADPEAAFALKETYLAILDIVLDGPKPSYHKWKEEKKSNADLLILDFDSLPTPLLVSMMIRCNDEIQNQQENLNPYLMTVVGMLVSVLGTRDVVTEGGEQSSGAEYRDRTIRVLCNANWMPRNLVLLSSLLRDVSSLSQNEWDYAMDTFVTKFDHIEPEEMPATVFQLLLISKGLNGSKIIAALINYYTRLNFGEGSVQDEQVNLTDEELEDQTSQLGSAEIIKSGPHSSSIHQSASTVLFHICQALCQGHRIYKDVLRFLKAGAQSPHLVLRPFIFFLGLAMASVKKFRQSVGETLRAIFMKQIDMNIRCRCDVWFNSLSNYVNMETLTIALIRTSFKFGGWDHIASGVLDLAMSLLVTSATAVSGRGSLKQRKAWNVGTKIILAIVKFSSSSVEVIMKMLSERILTSGKVGATTIQYTNCLSEVISQRRSLLMERPNLISDIIDDIATLEVITARNSVGLEGVMQLLMTFKIPSTMCGTQMNLSQASSNSLLSQSSEDIRRGKAISQDVICSDLMGVLKRALTQHVAVRVSMYQGLGKVSGFNPELTLSFLDILYQHGISQKWIPLLEDKESNLSGETRRAAVWNLDDLIVEHATEVEVTDACGWFMHCVVQVLARARQVYPNAEIDLVEHQSYNRLSALLDDTTKHHSNADISIDFDLIKEAEYSHLSIEGEANWAKVEHLKNVYESLIEHSILTGGAEGNEDSSRAISLLFCRYKDLCQFLKSKPSTKSGKGKKRVNDTIAALKKNTVLCSFSVPENAFSLRCLSDILKGLLNDRVPSRQRGFDEMRNCPGLIEHLLSSLLSKLDILSCAQSCPVPSVLRYLMNIGHTLSKALLMDEESDLAYADIIGECLLNNIDVISGHFPDQLAKFLEKIAPTCDQPPTIAINVLNIFDLITSRISVMKNIQISIMRKNRTLAVLMRLVNMVGSILVEAGGEITNQHVKDVLKKINDWTVAFGREFMLEAEEMHENNCVLKAFLDLLFSSTRRLKKVSDISTIVARQIHNVLGNLNETQLQTQVGDLPYVTEASSEVVFQSLSSHFDYVFESIELIVTNSRQIIATSSTGLTNGDVHYDKLERVECDVVRLLANLDNAIGELAQSGFRFGLLLDKLIKLLTRYMTLIDFVAKYFLLRCKTSVNSVKASEFEMLVEKTRVLTCHIYAKEKAMDKKTSNSAHRLAVKEQRIIPNLVMKVEQFENSLLKLNKKFNIGVAVKPSTSRDFRYKPEIQNQNCDEEEIEDVEDNTSLSQTSAIPLHADKETSDEDITLSPDPSGNHVGESTALHDNSLSSCTSPYGPGISCNRAGTSQHLGSPTLLPSSSNPHNSPRPEQILSSSRENTSSIQEPLPKKSKQKALGMRRR